MHEPSRVTAVLGPTNTGKTHYAIERMLAHRTGVIGLPLRLLAREVYDRIVATRGQAHAQTFEVECEVPALSLKHSGEGRSRRLAEQEAARRMLDVLKATDKSGSTLRA